MKDLYKIPFCDTHGFFFDDSGHLANQPNTLVIENSEIDEAAVFSVLQFGAIIPPFSPWQGVHRFLPGYQYHNTDLIGPIELEQPTHISAIDSDQQTIVLERLIDHALKQLIGDRKDPVLLFSGGVDSGLIASRLVALGYRDSLLLNYSFGTEDPESYLAEAMAKHLGLRFERVYTKRNLCHCLTQPGQVYSQPFGDLSTVPTSDLAAAVVDRLTGENRLIIDGTGADGAFGMTNKINDWNRVMQIPAMVRRGASLVYRSKLWHRIGKLEHQFRILRRSIDMPLLSAVLAQNPLAGSFYSNLSRNIIDQQLADWIGGWAGESLPHRIVAADMALTCANIFSQKGQAILEFAGHEVIYPFLENKTLSVAMVSISNWKMNEPKAPLKQCLSRYVPHNMVYRAKSGFLDPEHKVFFEPEFIAYLRAAADDTSPIAFILNKNFLRKACDKLSRRQKLPYQTLNCLWTIAFTDRWYRTAK
jgi:asparagine synthetase B (glutamine-hydrolysing)